MLKRRFNAFTLIELLIVVAIIAILAAIAVPNFLEAQVRSKVSRCKTDMRSIATAIEAYKVDTNHYPPEPILGRPLPYWLALQVLTTPVAYLSSIPPDTFPEKPWNTAAATLVQVQNFDYYGEFWEGRQWGEDGSGGNQYVLAFGKRSAAQWVMSTNGPDMKWSCGPYAMFGLECIQAFPAIPPRGNPGAVYDPTNGTISNGDIVRWGP